MGIIEEIRGLFSDRQYSKVIVFGVGNVGLYAAWLLEKSGYPVTYFIDNDSDKWNQHITEIPIKSPYDLLYEDDSDIVVFIAGGGIHISEMANQLCSLGLKEGVNFFRLLSDGRYQPADKIDTLLGISRGGGRKIPCAYVGRYR